jgi:hypothetical protein
MREPTKPSYPVALEARQVLMELHRAHPEDGELITALHHANNLVNTLWQELENRKRAVV